jgi:hydrogenase maturation protein HypF
LRITEDSFDRVAHFRTFRLPGGDRAVQEPRRVAVGLLYEMLGRLVIAKRELPMLTTFSQRELQAMLTMLERKLNSPQTSSAGRLFDAVAAITGIRHQAAFEGQAAMELEFAIEDSLADEAYPITLCAPAADGAPAVLDWQPMFEELLGDLRKNIPTPRISLKYHNALAGAILQVARDVGLERVLLTGGCFQNRQLLERAIARLQKNGFQPLWHKLVPPNDNSIAVGQIVAAARALRGEKQTADVSRSSG